MKSWRVVVCISALVGMFWLSPHVHPFVIPIRRAERVLAPLYRHSPLYDPEREAAEQEETGRRIRAERARALSAIPKLGYPAFGVVRVRPPRSSSPTSLEVELPHGIHVRGGEPVIFGDALVGFVETESVAADRRVARMRALTHPAARILGAVDRPRPKPSGGGPSSTEEACETAGGPSDRVVFGLIGGGAQRPELLVRYLAEADGLDNGSPVTTPAGGGPAPPGLRIGTLHFSEGKGLPRRQALTVAPAVSPARQCFLVVLLKDQPAVTVEAYASALSDPVALESDVAVRRLEARVVAVGDAAPGRHLFYLDVGAEAGVRPGCAVVLNRSLVGRVHRAGRRACEVATMGDPGFRVRALALPTDEAERSGRAPATVTLLGSSDSRGRRLRIDPRETALEGAALVTAPGDETVPAGLFVGAVESGEPDAIVLESDLCISIGDRVSIFAPVSEP